jgi:hypothetical protein
MPTAIPLSDAGFSHQTRGEALSKDFLHCIRRLDQDQELLIPSGFIADYISLGWIEMREGMLRLTESGRRAARRMSQLGQMGRARGQSAQ